MTGRCEELYRASAGRTALPRRALSEIIAEAFKRKQIRRLPSKMAFERIFKQGSVLLLLVVVVRRTAVARRLAWLRCAAVVSRAFGNRINFHWAAIALPLAVLALVLVVRRLRRSPVLLRGWRVRPRTGLAAPGRTSARRARPLGRFRTRARPRPAASTLARRARSGARTSTVATIAR